MKTMVMHRGTTALAIVAALALTGCSANSDPADPSDTAATTMPDACSLLTASDIATIIDASYGSGEHNDMLSHDTQDICEWMSSDSPVKFIQVLISPGSDQVASQRSSAEEFMGGSTDAMVAGGSHAYAVAGGSILGMTVGDYFVQVSNLSSSMDDVSVQTVALAGIVAGNM